MKSMGLDAEVLESGCCGMAGAFGYEKDKYEVSIAAGERMLLPRVRNEPSTSWIVADGFSCKSQIEQETSRGALHLAEVLKLARDGVGCPAYPEREASAGRRLAQRRSILRAGIVLLILVSAVVVLGIVLLACGDGRLS